MTIVLNGTSGITTPDIDVTAQSTDFVTSGDLTAAGIYLGGTGSANYLDDYEEGTFTPTLVGSGSNPSVTYNTTNTKGLYVKIGRVVYFALRIVTTAYSGGSGGLAAGGLPFSATSTDINQFNCGGYFSDGINYGASKTVLNPYVSGNLINLRGLQNNASNYDLSVGDYSVGEYLDINGFYFV